MLALFTENNEETDKILNHINDKFGSFIKEIKIFIVLTTFYPGREYLKESKREELKDNLVRKKSEKIKIDEVDKNILEAVSLNARAQLTELEEITKIKAEIIRYRLKNLIEEGVIQRFTIDLNNEKFGNSFYKLLIKLNPGLKEESLINFISQFKPSLRIHRIMGEKIIEADFEVDNDKEIREIIKDIKEKFGESLQELEILPVYAVRKLSYYPF